MEEEHLQTVQALLDGVQADGLPGLFRTVYRAIGTGQPIADCLLAGDNCFASAATEGQVWGCALSIASCIRTAPPFRLAPHGGQQQPPRPIPPPDTGGVIETPLQSEEVIAVVPDRGEITAADLVLAALFIHVHNQEKT
jgi:hypothetical protein